MGKLLFFRARARFLDNLFGQGFYAAEIVLKLATGEHAGGNLQSNLAFRRRHGDGLQVRHKGMVLFGCPQFPRSTVGMPLAVAFHRPNARHLTYARHETSP